MLLKMDDYYRIWYEGKKFDFKVLEIRESTHMWVVGSDEKAKELHVRFLKPNEIPDEKYYADLFDALKKEVRTGRLAEKFGKNILEIVFQFNKGVTIRFLANNIRAEIGTRVAETVLFMNGKEIYDELDRLFMKLSKSQTDLWICSDFNENV